MRPDAPGTDSAPAEAADDVGRRGGGLRFPGIDGKTTRIERGIGAVSGCGPRTCIPASLGSGRDTGGGGKAGISMRAPDSPDSGAPAPSPTSLESADGAVSRRGGANEMPDLNRRTALRVEADGRGRGRSQKVNISLAGGMTAGSRGREYLESSR